MSVASAAVPASLRVPVIAKAILVPKAVLTHWPATMTLQQLMTMESVNIAAVLVTLQESRVWLIHWL